ncbi:sulfatase family protein [Cerasicoccus frondis]|uniref:sulfatase family protein n=1 Tax=Cerasicoccus frondis TaxID=490090 RepID=UPI0028526163|nr:sulfatase-like hydrolase/transferase [Cerasicoccus frondis]
MKLLKAIQCACALAIIAVPESGANEPVLDKRPNFIFFITDDQFQEMMNFLPEGKGKNLTPATDALAAEGTILENLYVTSPVCTPSRFACLTGRYPSRSKSIPFTESTRKNEGQTIVEWNSFITKDDQDTLPWLLKKSGYSTGIVGKNHVIITSEMERPNWDDDPTDPEVVALLERNAERLRSACYQAGFDYAASLYNNNPDYNGIKALASHNQDWITQGGVDFIEKFQGGPFFLWFATTIPHGPGSKQRSWGADPRITPEGMLDEGLTVQPDRHSLSERLRIAGVSGWQKENLLWLDDSLAALVAKLDEIGELDNTVIIYFNDHGQEAKGTLYQGGVHGEGFIWRDGGFPVGNEFSETISNVDFAPTILDMAGVDYDPGIFDGVSFYPALMAEEMQSHDSLYFELGYVRAVLKDGWKYIALRYPEKIQNMSIEERKHRLEEFNKTMRDMRGRDPLTEDPMAPFSHIQAIPGGGDAERTSTGKYPAFYDADQLYFLPDDPGEQVNLSTSNPEKLAEMQALLTHYLNDLPGSFGELKP